MPIWSEDLQAAALPGWMIELAEQVKAIEPDLAKLASAIARLPTGVIVGSAVIAQVTPIVGTGMYRWHLDAVRRAATLRKPDGHPQPTWFAA